MASKHYELPFTTHHSQPILLLFLTIKQTFMTSKQTAKLNMYHAVDNCLTTNAAQVATVAALGTMQTTLQGYISSIETQAEIQETASVGTAADKNVIQDILCKAASVMAGQVHAWASSTNNTLLAEQMNISYSDLLRVKDGLLPEHCQTIHDTAQTNLVALAPFGVTAPKITALQLYIDTYHTKSNAPRDAEVLISAATEQVATLIKNADTLLKNQIDKLVNDFAEAQPVFYNQYYAARVIVDAPTSTTKATGTVKDNALSTNLPDVTITVDAQPYTTTTDAFGGYELPIPVSGTYTLIFTKTGYTTKQITGVVITLGQSTTVNTTMDPAP
jgi:hypothetical protein